MDVKIPVILRVVGQIQNHSKPIIKHCYQDFLLRSNDLEEREWPDAAGQIREALIHKNHPLQKDLEICLSFDHTLLMAHTSFPAIEALHQSLQATYAEAVAEPPARLSHWRNHSRGEHITNSLRSVISSIA